MKLFLIHFVALKMFTSNCNIQTTNECVCACQNSIQLANVSVFIVLDRKVELLIIMRFLEMYLVSPQLVIFRNKRTHQIISVKVENEVKNWHEKAVKFVLFATNKLKIVYHFNAPSEQISGSDRFFFLLFSLLTSWLSLEDFFSFLNAKCQLT